MTAVVRSGAETEALRASHLWWRLGVAGIAGGALTLAFAPFDLWWLAPLAIAGVTIALRGISVGRAALIGGLFGTVFIATLAQWLTVIGPDAWLAVAVVFGAISFGVFGAGASLVLSLPAWPMWFAAWWVSVEVVRGLVPLGGFPWGRVAESQVESPAVAWVSVGGLPLLSFVVVLVGALLAATVLAVTDGRTARAVALGVGALALLVTGLGVPLATSGQTITVAVVQGNVPTTGLDAFGQRQAVLDAHVEATHDLADEVRAGDVPEPQVVIWPENSSDIDPFGDPAAYAAIQSAVDDINVPVLTGLVVEVEDAERVSNRGVVWQPSTGPGDYYEKQNLVPFGEYVPFRDVMESVVSRLDRVPRDFVAGTEPGALELGPTVVADAICYDIAYDNTVRSGVRGGGKVITVQTNNATYGETAQVPQQFAISRLRAIEHGRTVLVAATSGISGVIAPDGDVLQESPEFVQEVLVADVPTRSEQTLATRFGEWISLGLAVAGALGVILSAAVAVKRRRAENTGR